MKVTIKKAGETVFFQKMDDDSGKMNKLTSHLMRLPKGDADEVILESNGHELPFKTVSLDITVVAKLANGVITKNADEAIVGRKTEPVAEQA
jgi:hypothetical protein